MVVFLRRGRGHVVALSRTESSDSVGGGKVSPHTMEEKLGSALNPNRAEMPGSKRKGSYDHVSEQQLGSYYRMTTLTSLMGWVY